MEEKEFHKHLDSSLGFIAQAEAALDTITEVLSDKPELAPKALNDIGMIAKALQKTDDMLRMTFVLFGFSIDAPKVKEYQKAVDSISKKMEAIVAEITEKAKASDPAVQEEKQKNFDEEKNIAPLDVKEEQLPSKEKIEDDILDLYAEQKEAVSKKEKEEIQKKIDRLYKILHSSLESKFRR